MEVFNKVYAENSFLDFGKYRGVTVLHVIRTDPSYIGFLLLRTKKPIRIHPDKEEYCKLCYLSNIGKMGVL